MNMDNNDVLPPAGLALLFSVTALFTVIPCLFYILHKIITYNFLLNYKI